MSSLKSLSSIRGVGGGAHILAGPRRAAALGLQGRSRWWGRSAGWRGGGGKEAHGTRSALGGGRATGGKEAHGVRIAIVGDVHDRWGPGDEVALSALQPDIVLFVGDFGNENVGIVKRIAALPYPKAAILGNHDVMHTIKRFAPGASTSKGRVREQITALESAGCNVGFSSLSFVNLNLGVVGGRPFTSGPFSLDKKAAFTEAYTGVDTGGEGGLERSAGAIAAQGLLQPEGAALVLLAHNGPSGLGAEVFSPCGRDWVEGGGDHGDPDLEMAVAKLRAAGRAPALVVFGHMHDILHKNSRGISRSARVGTSSSTLETVYVNAAVVPRVRSATPSAAVSGLATMHHFTTVEMVGGAVHSVDGVWVGVGPVEAEEEGKQQSTGLVEEVERRLRAEVINVVPRYLHDAETGATTIWRGGGLGEYTQEQYELRWDAAAPMTT